MFRVLVQDHVFQLITWWLPTACTPTSAVVTSHLTPTSTLHPNMSWWHVILHPPVLCTPTPAMVTHHLTPSSTAPNPCMVTCHLMPTCILHPIPAMVTRHLTPFYTLHPNLSWWHVILYPPVLCTPTLDEAHANCAHACELVDRLKALVHRLGQQCSKLLVVKDL